MKRKTSLMVLVLILSSLFLSNNLYPQVIQQWAARYNGPGNSVDVASSIAVDNLGNSYVTGYTKVEALNSDYATIKYNSSGVVQWSQTYNGLGTSTSYDEAKSIAVDVSGNVYVTGRSRGVSNYDIVTIKYNTDGVQQWIQRFNGAGNGDDSGNSMVVDSLGNVYIAGESVGSTSHNLDCMTIKYNTNGILQWQSMYNGLGNLDDHLKSIVIDNLGNVFVAGNCYGGGTNSDYVTIKYNSNGVEQWLTRYNYSSNVVDDANSIAVDISGNVYVTGWSSSGSSYDYLTIKYNSNGVQQWTARYNGTGNGEDRAYSIAVDNSGNVYVTGESPGTSSNIDYATVKYNSSGVQQWVSRYNSPANDVDIAYALTLDELGNIYVTGQISGTNRDFGTIKYNPSGVQQWIQNYNGPGNSVDKGYAIKVNYLGNVFVTGESRGSGNVEDYATIKYIQAPNSPINLTATAISHNEIIVQCNVVPPNQTIIEFQYSSDGGNTWPNGTVSQLPIDTVSNLQPNTIYYFRARATNQAGSSGFSNIAFDTTFYLNNIIPLNGGVPSKYSLTQNYPNPFNPITKIRFDIARLGHIKIVVFDVNGREIQMLVNESLKPGTYETTFDGSKLNSGVYFYKITAGDFTETKRMLLIK